MDFEHQMFMAFLLALRKNKIMNIKNRIWQNILWQNIDPESNFIKKIEFFDDENGSPHCRYDYQDKTNIGRWKTAKSDLRPHGNTWFIPYETIQKSRPHPTVFPVKLPEMCLKLHGTDKINLALDPFMGIGSTAVACKKLGVDFIGFEIDKTYADIAKESLTKQ